MSDLNQTPRLPLAALALLLPGVAVGQTVPSLTSNGVSIVPGCLPPTVLRNGTCVKPSVTDAPTYKTVTLAECVNLPQPRHYTAAEIDRLRAAVRKQLTTEEPMRVCVKEDQPEKTAMGQRCPPGWRDETGKMIVSRSSSEVEDRLRTYIAAGIGPEEVER